MLFALTNDIFFVETTQRSSPFGHTGPTLTFEFPDVLICKQKKSMIRSDSVHPKVKSLKFAYCGRK
jgi:hypothetical protein